ncbi:hypothetical protein MRB56_12845 [Halomonas cupida]|uniref:hypothetical protein n=1 Tax=Halomonas cupida TaxID=44933 RepID=UPI0039B5DBA5
MNHFERTYRDVRRVMVTTTLLVIGAMLLVAWSIVDSHDHAMESATHRQYCSEVGIWRAEAARGIPVVERTGHPDYNGIADQQCMGIRPAGYAEGKQHQLASRIH